MRLARLDLLRYGRFTDASIELPRTERGIHIVFGANRDMILGPDGARVREEAAEAELKVLGEQLEEAVVAWTKTRMFGSVRRERCCAGRSSAIGRKSRGRC